MSNDFTPTLDGTIAATPAPTAAASAAKPKVRISHLSGSLSGRTQELDQPTILIGRHPESQLRYDHTVDFLVSTRHGQLSLENGKWWYTDTNSTNGSYINGNRVQRQQVASGTVVSLGVPNAPGGASFCVETDGGGCGTSVNTLDATVADHNTPFAQEPSAADDLTSFNCARCGAANTAAADQAGEMALCKACGKPTRVPPAGVRPSASHAAAPAGSAAPPVISGAPMASPVPAVPGPQMHPAPLQPPRSVAAPPISSPAPAAHPAAASGKPGGDAGFFGGIIGGIKSNLQRRKERKEIQHDLAVLEQQIPQLETDLRQATQGLGQELWRLGKEQLGAFRATPRLNDIDAGVKALEEKQSGVDREFGEKNDKYNQWLAGWQDQAGKFDAELAAATSALADAEAQLTHAKQAVIAALASRADRLTAAAQKATELAAEARTDPQDDFWSRYTGTLDAFVVQIEESKQPIPELSDLLATRSAAREAVAAATIRRDQAAAAVQASKAERTRMDAEHAEVQRVYQQAQAAHRAEVDKVKSQAPPLYGDLGRQYLETKDSPQFAPAPPQLSTAKAALDKLSLAKATIAQKRQRLSELEAS
jgi:hypothetical protein